MILASSLLSTCLLYGFRPDPARIVVCLVTAVCSISLFPIPDGREVLSLWNSAVLLSLFALGLFCGIPADISIAAIIAYSLLVTVHLARLHIKEHHGRLSFGSAAWTGVMNYSRLMCMCVLSASVPCWLLSGGHSGLRSFCWPDSMFSCTCGHIMEGPSC